MKLRILGTITMLAICLLPRPVMAGDLPCLNPNIKVHNFTDPPGSGNWYEIGRFLLQGIFVMGACVQNLQTHTTTLHLITTMNNWPMESLAFGRDNLCLTNDHDFVEIIQESRFTCGVTMHPIVYGGVQLLVQSLEGNDYVLGGNGKEFIAADAGNDLISDSSPGTPGENPIYVAELYAGSGHDRVIGSVAQTHLHGGTGDDGLWDHGGFDWLEGADGHECCVYDSDSNNNDPDNLLCGAGEDTVSITNQALAQTGSCEIVSAQCNANFNSGPTCGIWFGPFQSI